MTPPKRQERARKAPQTAAPPPAQRPAGPTAEGASGGDERFRIISELTSDFAYAFTVTPEGRLELEWMTAAFTRITGYRPEELWPAGNWLAIIHPDDQDFVQERLRYVLSGADDEAEARIVTRDGVVRWLNIYTRSVWDPNQERVVSVYGAVRDITERKATEQTLQAMQQQLAVILNTMSEVVVYLGLDQRIVWANRAAALSAGREAAELVGQLCYEVWGPERKPCPWCPIRQALATGQSHEAETTHPDGRTWQIHGYPVYGAANTVVGIVDVSLDITERRRAEVALRESEERYRKLVETSPDAITLTDLEGRILMVNRRAAEAYGAESIEELVGQSAVDLVALPDREKAAANIQRTLEAGSISGVEYSIMSKDGSTHPVELRAALLRDAAGRPQAFIGVTRDIAERKQAEALLWQTKMVVEHSPVILYRLRAEEGWPFAFVSENVAQSGHTAAALLAGDVPFAALVHPDDLPRVLGEMEEHAENGPDSFRRSYRAILKNGEVAWVEDRVVVVRAPDGRATHLQGVLLDVTENRRLEEQFRQAQKMETIGRLAGGIAHDFNNFLTAIRGYAGLVFDALRTEEPARADVEQVLKAAERAASLTGQLLAFSRRQIIEPRPANLNDLVLETEKMLRRLIGEDIELALDLTSSLGLTRVDPGQITQALVNLVVNARDAMPDGGLLTIATANLTLAQDGDNEDAGVPPGAYVTLSVSDTGVGMAPEVKAHLFEPFFTTKEAGRGTGLGLATVYGIIKQHQGAITIQSEPGCGTTVRLYLPLFKGPVQPRSRRGAAAPLPRGGETILVVEDEPAVRALMVRVLRSLGYNVLETGDGNAAIQTARRHQGQIDLLLTDVVMPQMDGRMLAGLLQDAYESLRVLYVSGYATELLSRYGVLEEGVALLYKPFTGAELAGKVREVLDA